MKNNDQSTIRKQRLMLGMSHNFFKQNDSIQQLHTSLFSLLIIAAMVFLFSLTAGAASISLSWLPNSEADLAGYNLYYDTNSSGDYQNVINVGNQPQYTFVGLETGVTYRIALTAYDVYHNESDFSEEIQILIPQPDFKMEIGEVSLNHEWVRVDFQQPFVDPVVVANPLSCIGGDPTTARIRNVDGNGFEIRVQEWDYLNELHNKVESVSYLVMERGSYILDDGTRLEANSFATDDTGTFGTVSFDQPFQQVPVITTSIITENGSSAVTGRLQAISTESFQYCMQEQENSGQEHAVETIAYLAWEPSQGSIDGIAFDIARTEEGIASEAQTVYFDQSFINTPVVLASLQSTNDTDPANIHWLDKDTDHIDLIIIEEQSYDREVDHALETVGYLAFSAINEDADSDNDGITDLAELTLYGTDPLLADSDGDGLTDDQELQLWGDEWNLDLDSDGLPNILDPDSDNDGIPDGIEASQGTDPGDPASKPATPQFQIETGEVSINHEWTRIEFSKTFTNPVIIANPLSYNGKEPAVVRIRNLDNTGCDIRVQEWEYLNGNHKFEQVSYVVMEQGCYILDDGTRFEAGTFTTNNTDVFGTMTFGQLFQQTPVLATSIVTENETDAVTGRTQEVNEAGFQYCMQEQERNYQVHAAETVAYIAWEPSQGVIDGLAFEVTRTTAGITDEQQTALFSQHFNNVPVVLADMQTCNGGNTANIRYVSKNTEGIKLLVAEEQSIDSELRHNAEQVGLIILGQ